MGYMAYAADRIAAVVDTSLPCDRETLFGFADSDPEAAECLAASRALFAEEGIAGYADVVYGPLVPVAVFFTSCFVLAAWTVGAHPRVRGPWLASLLALTGVWVLAIGIAFSHWDAIDVASFVVD